jgi:glucose-1-phosphate adenylyltransferase
VQYAIVAENAVIGERAIVGKRPEECPDKSKWGIATIGPDYVVPTGKIVEPKAMLSI